jgi:hypothetical protein
VPISIFTFSDGTRATEWNTAFHFACRLAFEVPDYDCDFDISKVHEAERCYRRPDIILHKRGTPLNFLVVEMKMNLSPKRRAMDERKIREVWFANYNYKFGAAVALNQSGCSVNVVVNPTYVARTER